MSELYHNCYNDAMKRTIAAWLGVMLVIALAGAGYFYWQNSMSADRQNEMARQQGKQNDAVSTTEETQATSRQPGVFIDYSEGQVASSDGVQVLFFHAPWCPQCRMIEEDIKSDGVPDGVTILKVDYDSNQALRQKYDVTLQTTFVEVDENGNEIEKFVAYNEPTFESVKTNLLEL